jgi:RNA ligase (TIGR02306 family)
MSSLIVEVCRVEAVTLHPNADRMAIARVKGWETCIIRDAATGTTQFAAGDRCVFFPPDSVLPPDLSDRLGVTKYLSPLARKPDGTRPPGGRVRVANLRGFKSYGLIMPCENATWEVGFDVAGHYGVTKWEPPLRTQDGEAEVPHPAFHRYFDMENLRNFPDLIPAGEEVVVTEKIHGQNARLGLVRDTGEDGRLVWRWMAGSHDVRRKKLGASEKVSAFWLCFSDPVRRLLCAVSGCGYAPEEIDAGVPVREGLTQHDVVLFGERFGSGIQDMNYGLANGRFVFRAFDLTRDGRYLDFDAKAALFREYGVETVPILYRGPFDFGTIADLAEGATTVCEGADVAGFPGREGVVVTTAKEQTKATEKMVFERLQLKCISFAYLSRKDGTEYH